MKQRLLKRLLLGILILTNIALQAQIPAGYYNNAADKTGEELKNALHEIIKGHKSVSYSGLLDVFPYTDSDSEGKVWDIYSNYHYSFNNSCGSYDDEGDCWNREHTWPQSWFNNQTTPKCDLFHVYPTDGFVNGQRSNYPYGEVNNPIYTSGNGSKLGPCVTPGYSGRVFEPIDEYKGDIARGYFYMSVRYSGEDSSWGTSGMTNKSEILPWAMTMLLRWSDEDPVSDKEIARNNAIYNRQKNRNPFIDHPEYARMIWDPNYVPANQYDITYASNISNGTVSGPAQASEGSTVAITATPNAGYMVSSYSVYKTDDSSTTVNVTSNGTFTMPAFDVTVSANFTVNNTYYAITTAEVSHGSISVSKTSAKSGTTITMDATPANGYSLYSWYVYKTDDINTNVYTGTTGSFIMPAFDVTVYATFSTQSSSSNGDFVKVTENLTDWSGEYLIVYEDGNVAFNGGLTTLDAANNTVSVTINDNTIAATQTNVNAKFTIEKSGNSYTIKSASGFYIGQNSDNNGLQSNQNTQYANSISYGNNEANIVSSGNAHLRFNAASGQERFRYYKSSSYTGQKAIQLYKRASTVEAPTHKIHFEPNGGQGYMNEQSVEEFVPTALSPNTFTRDGFEFDGWNTQANGEGTYYADGATVALLGDLTLYAQWDPKYTVTLSQPEHGTINADPVIAVMDATITLTATPETGYELDQWIVTDILGNNIPVIENQFEMPASNVTVTAVFGYVGQAYAQKYYRITSNDELVAGRTYLIVNTSAQKALGTTQNGNNRAAATVNINENTIASIGTDVCELALGGQSGSWTFYDASNNGYLYAAGGGNYLRTQSTLNDKGKWTISIDNGLATIVSIGESDRNQIRYNPNNNNPIFSCYASTSNLAAVELYIRSEEYEHTSDETIANLFRYDKHTLRSGVTLTVNGTASCNEAGLLVIEDGGQLIHHNDGVKATFKKNISAYTDNGGWFTIATPFTTGDPEEITTNDYDLYAYDEDADLEWINYKNEEFSTLEAGQGFLYAHNPAITLRMTGTLNNGDMQQTVDLSHGNTNTDIRGFNLLGNPTAHAITFEKTSNVSDGYYYLNNDESWTYNLDNNVPAGRGFLVKANANGQTVTMNPQSKRSNTNDTESIPSLKIDVDGEVAYVKLSEGVGMPLLGFRGNESNVYLTRNSEPYIMLAKDGAESIELNFQSNITGPHHLSLQVNNAEIQYLHLIDRLNGNDIDLLAHPSYTFNSQKNDYAERFQLRFANNNESTGTDSFAFYQNGKIIVTDPDPHATLQVIDMTGRTLSNDHLVPGVYVLRLVSSERIRTQQIVIPN